jgi:hypothetical protein
MEIESERAKQRQSEAGKVGRDIQLGVGSNEHTPNFEGKARDIAARKVGLSPTTFQRGLVLCFFNDSGPVGCLSTPKNP